ncbi:MAG: dTDP-4-dehydrorhamnose 3,5-epimerase [Parvularculaceae bacterium]
MQIERLAVPDALLIIPDRFEDERGYFSETYSARALREAIGDLRFVQDNQSLSAAAFTLRGLHCQTPPHGQAKLVRVLRGRALDVAVDVRRGSPTFGKWASVELTAERGEQIFVPEGFLHGFLTLEPDTEVFYKTTAFYDKGSDVAVNWADADLAIDWGVDATEMTLSDRDRAAQSFAAFNSPFEYGT